MKKILSLILVLSLLLLVSCEVKPTVPHYCADNNGDDICDGCGSVMTPECMAHVDMNKNGKCDICDAVMDTVCNVHIDTDGDNRCDICGEAVKTACKEHKDADGNNECDDCGADITVLCTEHADSDKDGACDNCNISVVIILDFYAVNDTHGKFANSDEFTGVDELTTYLKNAYATDDNAVLLSSGDMWQGAAESNLTRGFIITDWMNDLDFASMTLGNHEFDWGSEYIKNNAEIAEFPILAINVYETATNARASYCESSVIIERDGIKIGIIGAIGDCYSSISSSKVSDVYFKTGSQLTALVKAESEKLRAEGAEFIVYSLHDGYGSSSSGVQNMTANDMRYYYDTALSNGYVDLVFEGHSHQSYIHRDNYGVYHLQTGGDDRGVAHVELSLNYITDEYSVSVVDIVDSDEYQHLDDDPIVETLLEKYKAEIAIAEKLLGTTNAYRNSAYIRQKVADLYYQYGMEKWGSTYDIALGGGYISTRAPYNIAAGDVYYGDLINILPFDNEIVLCSISGANLKSRFFETTNSDYFLAYGTYGESIKNNIDTSATYYVVVDTYSLDYAPNGLTYVDTLESGIYARDLFAEFVEGGGLGAAAGTTPSYTITPIQTILDKLDTLDYNVSTEAYYVKGTITSFVEGTSGSWYGNCYIQDENGDEIYVYGIIDGNNNKYGELEVKPQVGDTVILYGTAKHFRYTEASTPIKELVSMTLIEIVSP